MAHSPVTPYVLPQCGACPEVKVYLVHGSSALLFTMEPLFRACFPDSAANKNARYTKFIEKRAKVINKIHGILFPGAYLPKIYVPQQHWHSFTW